MWARLLVGFIISLWLSAAVVQGGTGFKASVRDFLGPRSPNSYGVYTIERVVDNHSVVLAAGHQVRYIGVGDFETSQSSSEEASTAYQAHKSLAIAHVARLEFDTRRVDAQGRLLAYVFLRPWANAENEIFLNGELIRQGLARYVPDPVNRRYEKHLKSLEEEAILARRGIWSSPELLRENH
ncbi:MAG: thermonuclease family protein [Candidatus Omnitrophica bacterium]|nr:thermonuclease family protein [Candidatus Omnitrophota bacterium]